MGEIFKGHGVGKGVTEAEAVVVKECVSIDALASGIYQERGHGLNGVDVSGKVIVFITGKGASFQGHSMLGAKSGKVAPAAMIFERPTVPLVEAIVIAEVPGVWGLEKSAVEAIKTGDRLRVNAEKGTVEIL